MIRSALAPALVVVGIIAIGSLLASAINHIEFAPVVRHDPSEQKAPVDIDSVSPITTNTGIAPDDDPNATQSP